VEWLDRQRGVSLIEVLVAVLVFSFGLVGLVGLLIMASRSNHSAYLHTQAAFLAQSLTERMRLNSAAVWRHDYDADYPVTSGKSACDANQPCDPTQLSDHDKAAWSRQLKTFLPQASATVACRTDQARFDPIALGVIGKRPPFGGSCTMKLSWNDRPSTYGSSTHARQTLEWEFQP
jgi:type IV pilus assembly protein PilV